MKELYINITSSNIDKFNLGYNLFNTTNIIGRGLHGLVLSINNYVIKIYSDFNIEINFYKQIINDNLNIENLTNKCAIGFLLKPFICNNLVYNKNSNIIILPKYIPLNKINMCNEIFLLNFIKKIFILLIFIKNKYNYINLDLKLINIMYDIHNKDIVLIDFSLIIEDTDSKIYIPNKYYKPWPNVICSLSSIPIYSMYICLIDILLENNKNMFYNNINKINSLLFYKKYSFFLINIINNIKNLKSMNAIINDIDDYNKNYNNNWFNNLLSFYYYTHILL